MWYNKIMLWILHSPLHGMLGRNMMVISFAGRKSGKIYQVPVGCLQIDNTLLTVSFKERNWWRNLRGGASVSLHLRGKDARGQAEVIEDEPGVMEGLETFIGKNPQAARMIGVKTGVDGHLETESLRAAARRRVIVRTTLI